MKTIQGKVISDKMTKTAVVLFESQYRHPLYGKILKKKKKIHVRNELGAKKGDLVEIVSTRPTSKTVSYKIKKIVKQK